MAAHAIAYAWKMDNTCVWLEDIPEFLKDIISLNVILIQFND